MMQPALVGYRKLLMAEVFVNIAPECNEQAPSMTHDGGRAARDTADQVIANWFGVAGSIIATAVGYLIEWRASGGATGFAGAMICPLIFIAVYQQLAQRAS